MSHGEDPLVDLLVDWCGGEGHEISGVGRARRMAIAIHASTVCSGKNCTLGLDARAGSDPVARAALPVGLAGSLVGRRGAVPAEHLAALPAGEGA